jgi:glycosyltransferase involved in cell wall biosynthesis
MNGKTMISVIIPAYNEAGNVEIITQKVSEQLKAFDSYEIIFIDDGSTDTTLEEIKGSQKVNVRSNISPFQGILVIKKL